METLVKAKLILDKVLETIMIILTGALCLIVLWQVFTRFILDNPSSWSEEFSRYILIWISLLGGSLGLSNGTHMGLVLVTDRIKNSTLKLIIHILAYIICGMIGYVFIVYGYSYALNGMNRTMMCCKFKMGYIYMMIPFCGAIIIVNCLMTILQDMRDLTRKDRKT